MMSLANPPPQQFIQALCAAENYVAIGSLAVERFPPEAANLEIFRDALLSFNRLKHLDIRDDVPLQFLSDHFLLAATHRRVISIGLKSHRFYVGARAGWDVGWNVPDRHRVEAAFGSEQNYPELCDGLLAFLFRDDLGENAKVELQFAAARVPRDFCLKLMKSAEAAVSRYPINASFVAVGDVNEHLVGFEEYRLLEGGDDNSAIYELPDPDPSKSDVVVELKIINITTVDISEEPGPPPTTWKLIEFRRYRESCAQGNTSFQ